MVPFIILGLGRCSEDPVLFQTCCRRQQNVLRSDKSRFVTFFSETLESLLPVPKCMYLGAWDTCCALRDRSSACFMAFFVHVCQYRIRLCPSSPHDRLPSVCTVLSLVISVAVRYCGACRGRTRERTRGRTRRHRRSKSARQPARRGSDHCRQTPRLLQSGRG